MIVLFVVGIVAVGIIYAFVKYRDNYKEVLEPTRNWGPKEEAASAIEVAPENQQRSAPTGSGTSLQSAKDGIRQDDQRSMPARNE